MHEIMFFLAGIKLVVLSEDTLDEVYCGSEASTGESRPIGRGGGWRSVRHDRRVVGEGGVAETSVRGEPAWGGEGEVMRLGGEKT